MPEVIGRLAHESRKHRRPEAPTTVKLIFLIPGVSHRLFESTYRIRIIVLLYSSALYIKQLLRDVQRKKERRMAPTAADPTRFAS